MMKLIIFDVGNAACSLISSPNNIGMMIDCGSSDDKENPIDLYKRNKEWLNINPFITSSRRQYELGLLHITHPDDDHVRNAKRIKNELEPYLLQKREFEEFIDGDKINQEYKEYIDLKYRGKNSEIINWGFDENRTFLIPMDVLKREENLSNKLRNNSSIIRFIKYNNIKILYCGDMETPGWDWLMQNDMSFVHTVSGGIDILIAPHHGHKSGFPSALFDIIGNVRCVIHSKGSEGNIEDSDVSTQYSNKATGVVYKNINNQSIYEGKVLTTRSNGNIYMEIGSSTFSIYTSKASQNHKKIN